MKTYKKVCLVIIVIIAIALVIPGIAVFTAISPQAVAAFNDDRPAEEDYKLLKEYALEYAKTQDVNISRDESIESITTEMKDGNLQVVVKSFKATVTANYPTKAETVDDKGNMLLSISYDEGIYNEESNIDSTSYYIGSIYFFSFILFCIIFVPLYAILIAIPLKIVQQRKKKRNK